MIDEPLTGNDVFLAITIIVGYCIAFFALIYLILLFIAWSGIR